MNRVFARMLLLIIAVLIVTSTSAGALVSGDYTPSSCVISNVHVGSIVPKDYSSTIVKVVTTFSFSCEGGTPGTVWNIQTKVLSESNLVGISSVSSAVNQYSLGQGTIQFIVNNQFDAMNYYGYGEQTPTFYVQITAINSSTGSLDAQQQAPFAVDTSQYPFNLAQQNYCHFPGLSEYFQFLPGCGAGTVNNTTPTASSSSTCSVAGLPQFYQPYLPSCSGSGNQTVAPSQSSSPQPTTQPGFCNIPGLSQYFQYLSQCQTASPEPNLATPGSPVTSPNATPNTSPNLATNTTMHAQSIESVLGIIILALVAFLMPLILKKPSRHPAFHSPPVVKLQGKFCIECGTQLQVTSNFCWNCGQACPNGEETLSFQL